MPLFECFTAQIKGNTDQNCLGDVTMSRIWYIAELFLLSKSFLVPGGLEHPGLYTHIVTSFLLLQHKGPYSHSVLLCRRILNKVWPFTSDL